MTAYEYRLFANDSDWHHIEALATHWQASFWPLHEIKATYASSQALIILCFQKDICCGWGFGLTILEASELLHIFTLPIHRRQGIADAILKLLSSYWQSQGVQKCFLEVNGHNQAAIELYQRHGFKKGEVRKGYYQSATGKGEDALVMTKDF